MPFCTECGKEVQNQWITCPFCSASIGPSNPNTIGIHDSSIMGNVSININKKRRSSEVIGVQQQTEEENKSDLSKNIVALGLTISVLLAGIWLIFPEWLSSDDDGDGILDENDWYDDGNGGLNIEFISFKIWDEGYYDDSSYPDVYPYIGLGDGNCRNFEYYEYRDDVNYDVDSMTNWFEGAMDVPDDKQSACVSVVIYDEDWGIDDILDYVPGNPTNFHHPFNLANGEGNILISEDNRGENELSISLSYRITRVAIDGPEV